MDVNFDKIDDKIVGMNLELYHLEGDRSSGRTIRQIKFREFIQPYCEEAGSRWQVYAVLRDKLGYLEETRSGIAKRPGPITGEELESVARDSLTIDSLKTAMSLIEDFYINRGKINNEPD